jgi:hypothetical protein
MIMETTDNLTNAQAVDIKKWFDIEIGTGIELLESGSGDPDEYYLLACDLHAQETQKFATYLKTLNIGYF